VSFSAVRSPWRPWWLGAALLCAWPATARADKHANCVQAARTQAEIDACPPPDGPIEVMVHAKPPPRSASDWEADAKTVHAAPHESGADALAVVPGVFVSDRGLPGRAPHLSLRGFDGTSGQDVEIFVGNIPMNQVSHLRSPGYADLRLVMPEVISSIRIANGPYDPRQGDFAVAGSVHMDLGLEKPGFWAKGGLGSFGGRRLFLAFAPDTREFSDTFAAFSTDSTRGPGGVRGGERSSFVGQFGGSQENVVFRVTVAIASARFDFPGLLGQDFVERGGDPYAATQPLGRDRTTQALLGSDVIWRVGDGTLSIGAFAGKTKTSFHQNLTGFALDELAGKPLGATDDAEQVNDAWTAGLSTFYRHGVELTSKRDAFELGVYARIDSIDQTDTRLFANGDKQTALVDDTITATNVAAYADAALYPFRRVVIRGGPRVDSLSFSTKDHIGNAGTERTAQGFHAGGKATIDVAAGGGVHVVASYGDGFRSPQARDLKEGERVPFTTVRSVEGGVRYKLITGFQASAVGFASWLSHDRVFDATSRENIEAPASLHAGASAALTARSGPFGMSVSGTYARARFTDSDANFKKGDPVPYAPAFVLRDDAFVEGRLGVMGGHSLRGRAGVGIQGMAGRPLPGGRDGQDLVNLDGLASVSWRFLEMGLNGTNLLGLRYYDAQYVYVSNFEKKTPLPPPSPHVLVAAPRAVFLTVQIHLRGKKSDQDQSTEFHCLRRARNDDERDTCRE
jgi:iron complex outermembrane receptor protein